MTRSPFLLLAARAYLVTVILGGLFLLTLSAAQATTANQVLIAVVGIVALLFSASIWALTCWVLPDLDGPHSLADRLKLGFAYWWLGPLLDIAHALGSVAPAFTRRA